MCRHASLFSLLLLALAAFSPSIVDAREPGQPTILQSLLDSLEQLLRFFQDNTKSINVDGMFALRIMQGHLVDIRNNTLVWDSFPSEIQEKIETLIEIPEAIYIDAHKQLEEFMPQYFMLYIPALIGPAHLEWKQRSLNLPAWDIVKETTDYVMTQQEQSFHNFTESDYCYSNILVDSKCDIKKQCITMLMRPQKRQYATTHQLLYTQIVELQGCSDELEKGLQKWYSKSIDEVKGDLCRSIYKDASVVYSRAGPNNMLSDLFLEQSALCLSAGFIDFVRFDWLASVLSWQRMNGCFGFVVENDNPVTGRKLLMERYMGGGCGSHISGLAASYLSSFLKTVVNMF